MSSLLAESSIIGIGLVAALAFGIVTIVLLAYLVLESKGNLWELLWRSLVLVAIIPAGVILITIPLITPVLLSEVMLDLTEEQLQLVAAAYILFVASASLVCQFYYIRGLVRQQLRDRNITFFEYFRYQLRYRSRTWEEEEEEKLEARVRAEVLTDKIDELRPAVFGPKITPRVVSTPTMDGVIVDKTRDYFGIRWKKTSLIAGVEAVLSFTLLWAGLLSLIFLPPGAAVLIPLLGIAIFLYFVGALTEVRMNETVLLVFAAPLVIIPLFVYSAYFLLGIHSLRDATLSAIFALMLFLVSALPVLLFFAVFLGGATGDWLLTGTTIRRFATRGQTVFLTIICTLGVFLIFQLNDIFFPPDKDKMIVIIECVIFLASTLGLVTNPLDEKLIICIVAPILAILGNLIVGTAVNPLGAIIFFGASLIFVYGADTLDLAFSKIRFSSVMIALSILLPLAPLSYLGTYFLVSNRSFFISIIILAAITTYISIKLHLEPEESLIISPIVTLGFIGPILIEGLFPRYQQLDDVLLGNLTVPLFAFLVFSVILGQKIRQNVLFIADDGHRLANRGERILDDWITRHALDHEVHPQVAEDLHVSFRIKRDDKNYLLQFWPKFKRSDDMVRYHVFQQKAETNAVEVDLVHPNDLDLLDSRLNYILKGRARSSTG
ncbi:MAG: hypothetical protein ACFFGZ_08635 [Candidatus Thorarchaeota archaeon]